MNSSAGVKRLTGAYFAGVRVQVAIPIQRPGNLEGEVTDYRLQFSFDGEPQHTHSPSPLGPQPSAAEGVHLH